MDWPPPPPLSAIGGLEVVNRRRVPIIMRVRGKWTLDFVGGSNVRHASNQ